MANITGEAEFQNSDSCWGVAYTDPTAPQDISDIYVNGRYPENGWAMNEVCHEMVYIVEGLGQLALKDSEPVELLAGTTVSIPPGEWFAWKGNLRLIMSCSPPFNKDQYKTQGE